MSETTKYRPPPPPKDFTKISIFDEKMTSVVLLSDLAERNKFC